MIKVFKDWKEIPDDFTGAFCIGQDISYSLNGILHKADGPAREYSDGRTAYYKRIPTGTTSPITGRS